MKYFCVLRVRIVTIYELFVTKFSYVSFHFLCNISRWLSPTSPFYDCFSVNDDYYNFTDLSSNVIPFFSICVFSEFRKTWETWPRAAAATQPSPTRSMAVIVPAGGCLTTPTVALLAVGSLNSSETFFVALCEQKLLLSLWSINLFTLLL